MSGSAERFLKLQDAADRLGISTRTVRRLVASGELPKIIKVRNRSVLAESMIQAYERRLMGGKGGMA